MPAKGWKKSDQKKLDDMDNKIQKADEKLQGEILKLSEDIVITHPDFFKGTIPPETKLFATIAYLVTRSSVQAEALTGVKSATIRRWKKEATWYDHVMRAYRAAQSDEIVSRLTKIVMKGMDVAMDRLENGDEVILQKTGEIVRKGVSGKDAATISAIAIDKAQLLQGNPTSRTEHKSSDAKLSDLQKNFEKYSQAKEIEGEVISDDNHANKDKE